MLRIADATLARLTVCGRRTDGQPRCPGRRARGQPKSCGEQESPDDPHGHAADGRPAPMRQVLYRDEVVAPLALDLSCRQLLLRVQRAIASTVKSAVYTADLHTTMPVSVLKQHEWEIAIALREISELRAEYTASASAAGQGPMTAAVLAPQKRALKLAQDATASRVSALERYAAQVEAADTAQRDWQNSLRVAGLNDKYLRPGRPHRGRSACHRGDHQPHRASRGSSTGLPRQPPAGHPRRRGPRSFVHEITSQALEPAGGTRPQVASRSAAVEYVNSGQRACAVEVR